MDNKKLLGKRIKQIRKSLGYTQEKLSELIDIETSSLSGIESGRFFPSLHVLNKMSEVLDIELIEFFRFETVNIPKNIDEQITNMINKQSSERKEIIYKILKSAFTIIE
ncbi:MAG: helix-turn-helix domain-containing protein [Candidatus Gastranaerophilaceae bacterium]